jgi:hypothetical protein
MKYLFYPIEILLVTAFVLLMVIIFSIIWSFGFLWSFKNPNLSWYDFMDYTWMYDCGETPIETWKWLMMI